MAFTGSSKLMVIKDQETIDSYFDELIVITEKHLKDNPRECYHLDIFDVNQTNKNSGKVVSCGFKEIITLVFENGIRISCTPQQNFQTESGGFIPAIESVSKSLKNNDGNYYFVDRIIQKGEKEETFSFKIQNKYFNRGIVDGFIVESNNLK